MLNGKKTISKKHTYRGIFVILFLACLFIGVFFIHYYHRLQSTIKSESSGYLTEVSSRIGSNVDRIISDNYAVLGAVSTLIQTGGLNSFNDISPIVKNQQQFWNYQDIILIDSNGAGYNSDGTPITLNNDTYFKNAIIDNGKGVSTTQMVNGQECIMFAIPVNEMTIDGRDIMALASIYLPISFDKTLSMESFGGDAYTCLINKAGIIMVRSNKDTSVKMGYSAFTTIEKTKSLKSSDFEILKQEIQKDKYGQIEFTQDNINYYMTYTPIQTEDWYLISFVPTSVVNEKSNTLMKVTLQLFTLITATFAGMIAFIIYSSSRNRKRLEEIAFVDEVTGGYTVQKFYQVAKLVLSGQDNTKYALVYSNIQKFKVLNEQFGRDVGDSILKAFHESIVSSLRDKEYIGRVSADNFCILMRCANEDEVQERLIDWFAHAEEYMRANKHIWTLPITEFGIYIIEGNTIPFTQMIDRAKLGLRGHAKNINSKVRYGIYDDESRQSLFREKHLEDMMEEALSNKEFKLYLQPKYHVSDEKIGGAEALTRWISPSEGMIYPDEFIPLFEKNGFVVKLDLWIFEEVCSNIKKWLDEGLTPVKISVNCSRVHLANKNFLNEYSVIADKYQIPRNLIEIEITESVVMGDVEKLAQVIDDIHNMGFGCSMDDFGSGYSSLNLIQSIPVDTLKLDKIFFRTQGEDPKRMEYVVASIVGLAKALSMETVAEGVEEVEQVQMLRHVGCDYIQGYVFAKPMPVKDFEALAFEDKQ